MLKLDPELYEGSCVYFIQVGSDGPIKIGFCADGASIQNRLTDLQIGNP
jgi:hypothetical protein